MRTTSFEFCIVEVNILQVKEKDKEEVACQAEPKQGRNLGDLSEFQDKLLSSLPPEQQTRVCKGKTNKPANKETQLRTTLCHVQQ